MGLRVGPSRTSTCGDSGFGIVYRSPVSLRLVWVLK